MRNSYFFSFSNENKVLNDYDKLHLLGRPLTAGAETSKSEEHRQFLAQFHVAWDNLKQKVKLVFVRLFSCKYVSLFVSALLMEFYFFQVNVFQVKNDFVACKQSVGSDAFAKSHWIIFGLKKKMGNKLNLLSVGSRKILHSEKSVSQIAFVKTVCKRGTKEKGNIWR